MGRLISHRIPRDIAGRPLDLEDFLSINTRAKFVVEWKMIVVCSLKFRSIQSEKEIDRLILTVKV
jgi:hypothetical protein